MADKITEGTILAVGLGYQDAEGKDKTAYIKVQNPKNNLTEQQVKEATLQLIGGQNPILRDSNEDPFDTDTAILTAYTEYEKKTEYDLGLD